MIISLPTKIALLIRLQVEEDDSIFVGTSPDLHGLIVTAHNLGDLFDGVPGAIARHIAVMGQDMDVIPALHPDRPAERYFVAIPKTGAAQ